LYRKDISNWIEWAPNDQLIWSPNNVKSVESKGLEMSLMIKSNDTHRLKWLVEGAYEYVDAVPNDFPESQLIYTPRHLTNSRFHLSCSNWTLGLRHHFESARYITRDNSDKINSFHLVDLNVGWGREYDKSQIQLDLVFHNLLNENYQLVALRPMPRRYFSIKWTLVYD
jgi:outer membrane cobalamin receptor